MNWSEVNWDNSFWHKIFENLLPLKFNGNDLITGMTMGHIIFNTKAYTITITALCMSQFLILVNLLHLHIYMHTYIHTLHTDRQTYRHSDNRHTKRHTYFHYHILRSAQLSRLFLLIQSINHSSMLWLYTLKVFDFIFASSAF